jgi:hypothetical protein
MNEATLIERAEKIISLRVQFRQLMNRKWEAEDAFQLLVAQCQQIRQEIVSAESNLLESLDHGP